MKRTARFYNVFTGSLSLLLKPDSYFTDPKTPNFQKSPRWYTKESNPSFYDPCILVSGPHNRNKDIYNDISIGEDTTVFGDSGGFQLATGNVKEKNWNREIALEWSEKNANIFPILDLPAAGKTKFIQDAIDYTVLSARYYEENRTRSDRTIMNVLSASRVAYQQPWYDAVKEFKFDGWAVGGHQNHLQTIISGIMLLVDNDEFATSEPRPLHVFGTTSMGVIPYLVYTQHLLNKKGINIQISFDSSSASALVNYGKFIQFCTPSAITTTSVSNQFDWTKLDKNSFLGCHCPICQGVDDIGYIFSDDGKGQFYSIIALHNYYHMLQYKKMFEGIVSLNNDEMLDSLPRNLKGNFKLLDTAFEVMGADGLDIIGKMKARSKASPNDKAGSSGIVSELGGVEEWGV